MEEEDNDAELNLDGDPDEEREENVGFEIQVEVTMDNVKLDEIGQSLTEGNYFDDSSCSVLENEEIMDSDGMLPEGNHIGSLAPVRAITSASILNIDSPPSSPSRGERDCHSPSGTRWTKSPKLAPLRLTHASESRGETIGIMIGKSISSSSSSFATDIPYQQETLPYFGSKNQSIIYQGDIDDESSIGSFQDFRSESVLGTGRQTPKGNDRISKKQKYKQLEQDEPPQQQYQIRNYNYITQIKKEVKKESEIKEQHASSDNNRPSTAPPPLLSIVGQVGEDSKIVRPYYRGRGFKSNKSSRADLVYAPSRFEVPRKLISKPRGFNGGEMSIIRNNDPSDQSLIMPQNSLSRPLSIIRPMALMENPTSPPPRLQRRISPAVSPSNTLKSNASNSHNKTLKAMDVIKNTERKKVAVLSIRLLTPQSPFEDTIKQTL